MWARMGRPGEAAGTSVLGGVSVVGSLRRRVFGVVGPRLIKTGIAVSLACGLMSLVDPTKGLVGAGVSAALMIAPDDHVGRQWARNQFLAALFGVFTGAVAGWLLGYAPWFAGPVVMVVILLYTRLGYPAAAIGGVTNALFILEHADRGFLFAAFRFTSSVVGLVIGWLVNRYVLPHRPAAPGEQGGAPERTERVHSRQPEEARPQTPDEHSRVRRRSGECEPAPAEQQPEEQEPEEQEPYEQERAAQQPAKQGPCEQEPDERMEEAV